MHDRPAPVGRDRRARPLIRRMAVPMKRPPRKRNPKREAFTECSGTSMTVANLP
jgi:hypothetical protein